MIEINIKNLVKAFEEGNNILNGLTLSIDTGERVGLLGKNGAGKTTLFRIITGELLSDEGEVSIAAGKRVGLMSQIPVYPENYTTEDVLKCAHAHLDKLSQKLESLTADMSANTSPELLKEYDRTAAEFERLGGYNSEVERNKVANGLEIPEHMRKQPFANLSGGEKTRVNLARLILEDTDILLLDEPTNHLDLKATEWLEEYLSRFKGTVIAISHDRYFLDRVVTRTIEIANGKAELYSGNYSFYVIERQRRIDEQLARYDKEQAEAKRLRESSQRLKQWGTGNQRLMKKAFAIDKRIERLVKTERPTSDKKIRAGFSNKDFNGDEVLVMENLSKSYDQKQLFQNVEAMVTGGERIALIGDNGTGKSTLIKLIMAEEMPSSGHIYKGPSVKTAYLPQHIKFKNPNRTVLDTLLYEDKCSPQTARNRLGAFKFSGDDVFKPVSALSGGEKSRLRLCMLMKDDINFLILDEPTNHLDISSREWIEEALEDYEETLLFVSHDRYFVDRFATRIWELSNGKIIDFMGSFEKYKQWKQRQALTDLTTKTQKRDTSDTKKRETKRKGESVHKKLERAERDIEKCEAKIAQLDSDTEHYSTDYQKLLEIADERKALEDELNALYMRWEELSS